MILNKKGFTLIEVLVVIAITVLIVIGAGNLNLGGSSQQKLDTFNYEIISLTEEVRNFALVGKGTGSYIPNSWKVTLSPENTTPSLGVAKSEYEDDTSTFQDYNNVNIYNPYSIKKIECEEFDGTTINEIAPDSSIEIIFEKNKTSLKEIVPTTDKCSDNFKKIIITTAYGSVEKSITFDKITSSFE